MRIIIVLFFSLMTVTGQARDTYEGTHLLNFDIPNEFYSEIDFLPVSYLDDFTIKNPSEKLTAEKREKLKYLFIAATNATFIKYKSGHYLTTDTPIYKLLKINYPNINFMETEHKRLIFLSFIKDALIKNSKEQLNYIHDQNFNIPKEFYSKINYSIHDFIPANYLETFPIKNIEQKLDKEKRKKLKQLFIQASIKYQSHYISVNIPIYKLLKFNYPKIKPRTSISMKKFIYLYLIKDALIKLSNLNI